MIRKIVKIVLVLVLIVIVAAAGFVTYLKAAYPKVGPIVEVKIEKKDTALIARGKYLFYAVSGCVDCHSPREMKYFGAPPVLDSVGKGGFVFNSDFGVPGTLYGKNITPTGLGTWTDAEIYHTITTGVSKDGTVLFPLMPYTHFGKGDPEDIKAIVAYVRTLKPLDGNYPDHKIDFPVSLFIRMAPAAAQPTKRPLPSDTLATGEYLFNMAGCNECHSQRKGPDIVKGLENAGGVEYKLRGAGIVRSANITPDRETGIGNWTKEMFIETFKFYQKPENRKIDWKQKGYATVMPWIAHSDLTREDLAALYKYLRTLTPIKNKVIKWTAETGIN